jgi:hypothetical protein
MFPRKPAHLRSRSRDGPHHARLLFGRMIGMVTEGVTIGLALAAWRVPMAALLG